jgi:osmotically-inducible protein OsmY
MPTILTTKKTTLIEGAERIAALDRLIVDNVQRALRASGYGQLLKLKAFCEHGRVTLQGCVPTYYLKQVAQSVLRSIDGIRDIDNDVKVTTVK